jgi:protein-tyrosine phosphatase
MRAEMYEIIPCPQGRLATMPRPRADEWLKAEIASLQKAGVTDLVSMLTLSEEVEIGLLFEPNFCDEFGIRFHRYSLPDRSVPLQPAFDDFIASLLPVLQHGGFIAIHCRAGIGRSSVVAAGFLCALGVPAHEALRRISHARGFDVPDTQEQLDFILSLDHPRDSKIR